MVFPTATQTEKSADVDGEAIDKVPSAPVWANGAVLPPIQSGNGKGMESDFVKVKVPKERRKKSTLFCVAVFVLGFLIGAIFIAGTVFAIKMLSAHKREAWVECNSNDEYHKHKPHEHKKGELRGKRPYFESGHKFLEWMEVMDDIWKIYVPNFGHDIWAKVAYEYTMMVDFNKQAVAFKISDTTGRYQSDCFVAHAWDLDIPDKKYVEEFLDGAKKTVAMHIDKMQYYYFERVPLQPGRDVGVGIEALCKDSKMYALSPIVDEIREQVEDILGSLGTSYQDLGELADEIGESAEMVMDGDLDEIDSLMESLEELLAYIPHMPSGSYSFVGDDGVAMSINIKRPKHLEDAIWDALDAPQTQNGTAATAR